MNLLSSDYQLLMSILSKNMTEGANERVAPKKPPEIGKIIVVFVFTFWFDDFWFHFMHRFFSISH